MGISFTNAAKSSNAFSQSVPFADFLIKVSGHSASCSSGERIHFNELCNVWPLLLPKIEKFMNEHYEEGGNYREFLKLSCQE